MNHAIGSKNVFTNLRLLMLSIGSNCCVSNIQKVIELNSKTDQVLTFDNVKLKSCLDIEKFTAGTLAFKNMCRIAFCMYKSLLQQNHSLVRQLKTAYKLAGI